MSIKRAESVSGVMGIFMKKKRKRNAGAVAVLIVCLALIVFSLSKIVPTLLDYRGSEKEFEKLEQDYVRAPEAEENRPVSAEAERDAAEDDWKTRGVSIDFDALEKINPDVAGWLRFDDSEDLDISYPVMYSGDDETYLRTDLYGNSHIAGSIFLSGSCKPDFSDYHILIYGHNMRNGTMFGSLKKYWTEEGFYENHPYFTLYTREKAYRYQIFAYSEVQDDSGVYAVGFGPDEQYQALIDDMLTSSWKNTGIVPQKTDRIITLSTCSASGDHIRFVVHAVCVDEVTF